MILETQRSLSPWAWYAGAHQQYQVAFLLLGEVWAYPMRKEADRIWRCLDYVFEPPADLSRDQKARLTLTEIRDRMGVYKDVRKLRAPTGMLARLGMTSPRKKGDVDNELSRVEFGPGADSDLQIGVDNRQKTIMGVRFHGDEVPIPPPQPPSLTMGSSASKTTSSGMSPDLSMTDELMNDIDWVIRALHAYWRLLIEPLG